MDVNVLVRKNQEGTLGHKKTGTIFSWKPILREHKLISNILVKAKKVLLLQLTQFQPIINLTDKDLERVIHKPPKVTPYHMYPGFQTAVPSYKRELR